MTISFSRYPEEKDGNGRTLYGGVRDGNIVGGTKVSFDSKLRFSMFFILTQVYLGPDFKSILTGMVSIDAQGRVGVQEVILSLSIQYDRTPLILIGTSLYSYPRWNMQGSKGFL